MRLRNTCLLAFIGAVSSGCASLPQACKILDSRDTWSRLEARPELVDDALLESMYFSGNAPQANELIWYTNSTGQIAACNPGNRFGCGDHVVVYDKVNGSLQKADAEEIVLCGA